MPRTPINYADVYFYKTVCKYLNITECYVGHTTNFTNHKNQHKSICNYPNNGKYNLPVYKCIRDNGNWDNWDMIEIERIEFEYRPQLLARERYWLETLKASLNCNKP